MRGVRVLCSPEVTRDYDSVFLLGTERIKMPFFFYLPPLAAAAPPPRAGLLSTLMGIFWSLGGGGLRGAWIARRPSWPSDDVTAVGSTSGGSVYRRVNSREIVPWSSCFSWCLAWIVSWLSTICVEMTRK